MWTTWIGGLLSWRESNPIWFKAAYFRPVCVKNPRNASAFLRFSPWQNKNLSALNCEAPKSQIFACNRVFLRRRHTVVCQDEKCPRVREYLPFGHIGFGSRQLNLLFFWERKSKQKKAMMGKQNVLGCRSIMKMISPSESEGLVVYLLKSTNDLQNLLFTHLRQKLGQVFTIRSLDSLGSRSYETVMRS